MDWLLPRFWDPRSYFFWLVAVSLLCLALERIRPWRTEQRLVRAQFGQDVAWLLFNGHYAGILIAMATARLLGWASPTFARVESLDLVSKQPIALQIAVFFVLKDLLEWCVHNLLHRVPWLWKFHQVHHSIVELDWIGNFRFHWMEIVVYHSVTYLPLSVLGVDARVLLPLGVLGTLIGDLNHSNLDVTWGPLRYVLNSPRMHVWHHDRAWPPHLPKGVNFGIQLSLWDWLFGTAWWPSPSERPRQQPDALGFPGDERLPRGFSARLLAPFAPTA